MTVRRRVCQALACPRRVDQHVVFCNVHWPMLRPQDQAGIVNNREAPALATQTQAQAIGVSIDNAVTLIAKKEGRSRALKQTKDQLASSVEAKAAEVSRPFHNRFDTAGSSLDGDF